MVKGLFKLKMGGLLFFLSSILQAEPVQFTTSSRQWSVDIDLEDSLMDLFQMAESQITADDEELLIAMPLKRGVRRSVSSNPQRGEGKYLGYPRDYLAVLSTQELQDIHFILKALANRSLVSLAFSKTDLEKAGERIDHIHPLRFLMTIFTDEELKVAIKNVHERGWVWNNFISGLRNALETEMSIGNMKDEYIMDFAQKINLNPNVILPSINLKDWDHLVVLLIQNVPRKGNPGRYDN